MQKKLGKGFSNLRKSIKKSASAQGAMEQKGRLEQPHEAPGYNCSSKRATTKDQQQVHHLPVLNSLQSLAPGYYYRHMNRKIRLHTLLSPHILPGFHTKQT